MQPILYRSKIPVCSFIKDLADVLEMPNNISHVQQVLTAFSQTFRERISPFSSSAFIAYLPKTVKNIYTEGWDKQTLPSSHFDYTEFIEALSKKRGLGRTPLFASQSDAEKTVALLFKYLEKTLVRAHYDTIMSYMPLALRLHLDNKLGFDNYSPFM